MRIRWGKNIGLRRKARRPGKTRFAWLPKRLSNGTIIWLEHYRPYLLNYHYYHIGGIGEREQARE